MSGHGGLSVKTLTRLICAALAAGLLPGVAAADLAPLGNLIDVVDDTIGYDPEALYELDICGPWLIRAYAYDASVGLYDLYTEYF